MTQFYSDPSRENDPHALPDCIVEFFGRGELRQHYADDPDTMNLYDPETDEISEEEGFYWCYCFPGCIPDSDWFGPFKSEEEAIEDARSYNDE